MDTPKTEKHSAHGDGNGLRYGLSSMQGWRGEMEDAHTAEVRLPGGCADWSFFAVYDGHAGSRVAEYCSKHMLEHILGFSRGPPVCPVKPGVKGGFLQIDEHMRRLPAMQQQGPEPDPSGCTAVGLLLSPDRLYFINCGDSRAVLCRNGEFCFSTVDHKPCDPREMERIQNAGGHVTDQRVNGSLAVSRALGDYQYKGVAGKGPKEQPVSAEPEVTAMERAAEGDEFVVLACDGVWDVMSNEELCEFVRSRLQVCDDLEKVCNEVLDTCLHKGSRDNMSVVLVCFPGAPKVSEEAVREDKELDTRIRTWVKKALLRGRGDKDPDLMDVVQFLAAVNIPNLPPGGGLDSKRSVIDAAYNELRETVRRSDGETMGAFLDTPKTEKHSAHGDGNGLRYGLSSMQGWRGEMEDAHTAEVRLPGGYARYADWSFFAVYDGHAGSRVADYCSKHMLKHFLCSPRCTCTERTFTVRSVKEGFLQIDEHMRRLPAMQQQGPEPVPSGCTAVGLLLSPDRLYFINCGDSRAVLCRNGEFCFSTVDHKPCDPREMERIQNAGGHVTDQRVNGSLAVSRALGDYQYKGVAGKGPKEQPVSAEPEVTAMKRAAEGDEFVVLACDGVWDVMSNEELCEFVRSRLQVCDDLEKVCNEVLDTCLHKGSRDNMSVVLVCFPGAPKVSEEAVREDKELDTRIRTWVKKLLLRGSGDKDPDLMDVVQFLAAVNIHNLPPGGGLDSKRSVIDAAYNELRVQECKVPTNCPDVWRTEMTGNDDGGLV